MVRFFSIDFSFDKHDLQICLPILTTLVFFGTYWFISQSVKIKNIFYARYKVDQASCRHVLFTKVAGFVLMGIFPVLICMLFIENYSLADYGLTLIVETTLFSILWIIGLSMVVIPLTYYSARRPGSWGQYPQIRAKIWTKKTMVSDASGWLIYLFGYEFLFRGVLLFPLADAMGVWPAIALNIALYSATHIPKGLDETIGAVPLGFVLCVLTLQSGTMWIAFFVHVAMAWTNSFTALKYNPETNYTPRKNSKVSARILKKRLKKIK